VVSRRGSGWRLVVDTTNRRGATATATFR
jgi:hypothetical protein